MHILWFLPRSLSCRCHRGEYVTAPAACLHCSDCTSYYSAQNQEFCTDTREELLYNKEKLLANGDRAEAEIAANLHCMPPVPCPLFLTHLLFLTRLYHYSGPCLSVVYAFFHKVDGGGGSIQSYQHVYNRARYTLCERPPPEHLLKNPGIPAGGIRTRTIKRLCPSRSLAYCKSETAIPFFRPTLPIGPHTPRCHFFLLEDSEFEASMSCAYMDYGGPKRIPCDFFAVV